MKEQEYHNSDEQIIQMLTPKVEVKPSPDMRAKILAAAEKTSQQATAQPKRTRTRISYWLGAVASAAAVIAVAITLTVNNPAHAAHKYFSGAIMAANDIKTMVMKLSVRTQPDEPIDYINPKADFIPATIKVIYGEPMLWSIEKKNGRTILYKGADNTGDYVYQWIGRNDSSVGWKAQHEGYVKDDLEIMLNPRLLLEAERRTADRNKSTNYEILDLGELVIVRVWTTAQGDFSKSDYMLNTSLAEAKTFREYSFAKDTGLLHKLRIAVVVDNKPITIMESESIDYNVPLTVADLYNKELFDNIPFSDIEIKADKSSPLLGIKADEAAKIVLEAMKEWDMTILDTAMAYFRGELIKVVETKYKGLEVKSIGQPFKSGLYPGQFVKCKVIMADGSKETLTLALRNDNPQRVWVVDGGL